MLQEVRPVCKTRNQFASNAWNPYLFTGRESPLKKRMVQQLFADYTEKSELKADRSTRCAT
jgi:hypothetical protein